MSEERKRILSMVASGKITVEEGEELLSALSGRPADGPSSAPMTAQTEGSRTSGKMPRFLRVVVESADAAKVNVRIPLNLVRAGMKLESLMPESVRERFHDKLEAKGIDLSQFAGKHVDELIESLADLTVDVDDKNTNEKVRVFCE